MVEKAGINDGRKMQLFIWMQICFSRNQTPTCMLFIISYLSRKAAACLLTFAGKYVAALRHIAEFLFMGISTFSSFFTAT